MSRLPSSILVACTHNSIRSPMAERLLKHWIGTRAFIDSVGVVPGQPDPFAVEVMRELGLDMSGHRVKTFEELQDDSFDLVISLSPEAHHHAVEMTRAMACEVEFWNTFDPSVVEGSRDTRLAAYRNVRDTLFTRIRQRFPKNDPESK